MIKDKKIQKNMIITLLLLVITFVSVFGVTKVATSTEIHADTIQSLDDKKMTALGLTASVTVASSAISALPGDAASPIAQQLAELTTPLLIIVCAIYLEKFLLTTLGYISFQWLMPIACGVAVLYIWSEKGFWKALAMKLTLFALAISLIIPVSFKVTSLIEVTFEESISQTMDTADEIGEEAEKSEEKEDSKGFLSFLQGISDGVTEIAETAKNALSVFIDAIAVLVITTCVIPIAVMALFIWCLKLIFGIEIPVEKAKDMLHRKKR